MGVEFGVKLCVPVLAFFGGSGQEVANVFGITE